MYNQTFNNIGFYFVCMQNNNCNVAIFYVQINLSLYLCSLFTEYPTNKCVVTIDGLTLFKNVGDTWNTIDNCIKGSCKLDESEIPQETFYKQKCDIICEGVSIFNYNIKINIIFAFYKCFKPIGTL